MEPRQPQHVVCHGLARFDVAFRRRGHLLLLPQLPRHQRGGLRQHRRLERQFLCAGNLRPRRQHQHGERDVDQPGRHRRRKRETGQSHLHPKRRLDGHRRHRRSAKRHDRQAGLRRIGDLRAFQRLRLRRQRHRQPEHAVADPRLRRFRRGSCSTAAARR